MNTEKKMYVLVRLDLSETYRMVQGAHALAQFAIEYPEEFANWSNRTIVFVGVYFLKGLRVSSFAIGKQNLKYAMYYEPDLDDQATAIACYCDGNVFKDLKAVG